MSDDYRAIGYNDGRGYAWKNSPHEEPQTEIDRYSYRSGYEEGERRKRISDEIDRELYGDEA